MTGEREGIVARAGVASSRGVVFEAAELRAMANGKTLFYDEGRGALIYRGKLSAGEMPEPSKDQA